MWYLYCLINKSNEFLWLWNRLYLFIHLKKKKFHVFCHLFSLLFWSLYPCLFLSTVQLMFGRFGQVVEKKKSISLQDISAVRFSPSHLLIHQTSLLSASLIISVCSSPSQEERRQLSSMLGCEISSMLCVPVVSRATGHVVALACAFNKQGGQRFEICLYICIYIY